MLQFQEASCTMPLGPSLCRARHTGCTLSAVRVQCNYFAVWPNQGPVVYTTSMTKQECGRP